MVLYTAVTAAARFSATRVCIGFRVEGFGVSAALFSDFGILPLLDCYISVLRSSPTWWRGGTTRICSHVSD